MHQRSPKRPIIVGCTLILIVVLALILAMTSKPKEVAVDVTRTTVEATSTVATTTPSENHTIPNGKAYSNTTIGYSLQYNQELTLKENADYPLASGSKTKATVLSFATSTLASTTIQEANINIAETKTECALWADGTNKSPVTATKTINGIPFEYREESDAGAGNLYTVDEYNTTRDNGCFRVALYMHLANPGMVGENQTDIDSLSQANEKAINHFLEIFEEMMSTVTFAAQ